MTEKIEKTKTEKEVVVKLPKNTEERADRFKRIATQRQNSVIDRLALLGRIADNPQNYKFDAEQVLAVMSPIKVFVGEIERKLLDCLSSNEIKEDFKVSL